MTKKFNYVVATATTIAMLASATPAFAGGYNGHGYNGGNSSDNDIVVTNVNNAVVLNATVAVSNTGGNEANGGDGEEGGDGGDAEGNGDGGNGGNGGNGGVGAIETGDAEANAGTLNIVNTNAIDIDSDCGCDKNGSKRGKRGSSRSDNDIVVTNVNTGVVGNLTAAGADTGNNDANGGDGEEGGDGGDSEDGDDNGGWSWKSKYRGHHGNGNGNNNDGDAGNGGNGGDGAPGVVYTGDATSTAGTINVVNTNFMRISKGGN